MSNIVQLFPDNTLGIKYVFEVVDELADAALKKHGLERGPIWLLAAHDIAEEICARKQLAALFKQGFHFTATLTNTVRFRMGSVVLDLDHLANLYDLAENVAKHGLLPTEDEYNARQPPVES
jgi:hypothetical protein